MANRHLTRTTLGDHFSEGARLLWAALTSRGWSQHDLCRALDMKPGTQSRWLYGDQRPGLVVAVKLHDLLAIPVETWNQAPKQPFQPPAAA